MRAGRYLKRTSIPPVVTLPAVVGARLPETRINAASGRTAMDSRIALALGGPFTSLRFVFSNFQFDGNGDKFDPPTPLTIEKAALELHGITRPILFGAGSRSAVLPSGHIMEISRPLLPSAYCLPEFRMAFCYFRGSSSVPNNTGWFPIGCIAVDSEGDSFGALYDPANDLDQVDGVGPMTLPTGALPITDFVAVGHDSGPANNMSWGPSAVIGETRDKRMVVMFILGPSTVSGREYGRVPTSMRVGWGFADLANYLVNESGALVEVVPTIRASRTGAMLGKIGFNPGVTPFFRFAGGPEARALIWDGNNGIANDDYTPKQEVDVNLTGVHALMAAAGITKPILTYGMPRNSSTDSYTTYAGLDYSGRYAAGGAADYLNRRIAEWLTRHREAIGLPFAVMRSILDPRKWYTDEVTPELETPDGLHAGTFGHGQHAAELRWARQTGVGLSPLSKNWAAACIVRPSEASMAIVEEVLGRIKLSGARFQQLFWCYAPIDGSDRGYQTRHVNLITPGVWDLFAVTNPSGITYGDNGMKSAGGASQQMGFYNTPASDWSPGVNNTPELAVATLDDLAIFVGVNDDADALPVFGSPTATTAQRTLFVNPRNASGVVACRLNDTTNPTGWTSTTAAGDWAFIRNGNTRWAFQDKVQIGTDSVAPTQLSNARCRLFGSINSGDTTTKEVKYFGIGSATPAQAADVVDALRLFGGL
jgi:hypothetical protein